MNKEMRKIIKAAKGWRGWTVTETRNGWKICPPDKSIPCYTIHGSPSDHRAIKNITAALRRMGAPI